MLDFIVDKDKCTQCGECVRDCLYGIIGMDDEYPFIHKDKENKCIGCQHCLAVCKPGAISVFGLDPADSLAIGGGVPEPARMENMLLGRRSVRRYKKQGVDPKLIRHLLEIAAHAPTAVNQQKTRLTVVDDPEAMDRLRERATSAALEILHEGRVPEGMERLADFLEGCKYGQDVIFRGAPHLLVASSPADALSPMADGHIAVAYFELLAASHGLGAVWNGIARMVISVLVPELKELLGIPHDHQVVCAMSFGKPAVKYHRAVQRTGDIHRAKI